MKISAGILVLMVAIAAVGATSWKRLHNASSHETASAHEVEGTFTPSVSAERLNLSDLPRALEMPLIKTPLQPGDLAPDFNLPDQSGQLHRLSDLRGQTVVLAFYPRDFTLSCSGEVISFDQNLPAFQMRGAKVFSVSVQNFASKALFAGRYNISYPLLADSDKTTARNYQVLSEDGTTGRVTFIIGTDGRIQWTDQNAQALTHARDVLRVLDERTFIHSGGLYDSASFYDTGVVKPSSWTQFVTLTPPVTAPRFVGNVLGLGL